MSDAAGKTSGSAGTPPAAWCHVLEAEYRALYGEPALPAGAPSDQDERLRPVHERIHARAPSALTLSGGGIRSATFALGVLQGLAHLGILGSFDYLSTVSGGGYTGGWYTAWLQRAGAAGRGDVLRTLDPAQADLVVPTGPDEAGQASSPVERVRLTCRYLAPRGGAVSADVWALLMTMGRNLLLNWMVLLPLIAAVLLIPRFYYCVVRAVELGAGPGAALAGHPSTSWLFLVSIGLAAISVAYLVMNFTGQGGDWSQHRFLIFCLAPLAGCAMGMTLFWAEFPGWVNLRSWVFWSAGIPAFGWLILGIVTPRIFRRVPVADGSTLRVRVGIRTVVAALASGPVLGAGAYWFRVVHFGSGPLGQQYAVFAVPFFLGLVLLQIALFVGFASSEQDDAVLEWWSRCGAWIGIAAIVWLGAGVLVFFLADLIEAGRGAAAHALALERDTSSGLLALIVPLLSSLMGLAARSGGANLPPAVRGLLRRVALPATIVLLLSTVAWANVRATEQLEYHRVNGERCTAELASQGPPCHPAGGGLGEVLLLGALLTAGGLAMSAFVPVNRFSLHGMYRQRIIRTFLGASRRARQPNRFTGFDANDDLRVHELASVRPLHVINTTLNAVLPTDVGRHEISAQSFSFTPFYAGSRSLGYRPARQYGSDGGAEGTGLSLGMALAVSGAAASPEMGIYSSKPRAFLLTLANARLGLWLGNPSSDTSWQRSDPPLGVGPLSRELLGLTTDNNPYVYLSDGGHYENLGLYEMVARRCHVIVVSDAGCDPDYTFDDLANAVRRIRLDLGIPVQFAPIDITRAGQGRSNPHAAIGVVRYSIVDGPAAPDGVILYLKATLSGDETVDVLNFATSDPLFPHDSTANQFYDEARFESYRALGFHTVLTLAPRGTMVPTVEALCEIARRTLESAQARREPVATTGAPGVVQAVP